jgi:hypothetical protein
MVEVTRRDFIKMAGAAGVGAAVSLGAASMLNENNKTMNKTVLQVGALFLASAREIPLKLTTDGSSLNHYSVKEVVPVLGETPNIAQGWSVVRIETPVPISLSEELSNSLIKFHGATQHLHYTTDSQRQELKQRAIPELEPSDHTTAVLIPIGKSEEWWKLAQDKRQSYFQKSEANEGHTAIGIKYVDRVFRKLYHSRYLGSMLNYDFLTYFEFEDVYAKDFKTLLAELRDTKTNPEWAYVNYEFEIWMTKIG